MKWHKRIFIFACFVLIALSVAACAKEEKYEVGKFDEFQQKKIDAALSEENERKRVASLPSVLENADELDRIMGELKKRSELNGQDIKVFYKFTLNNNALHGNIINLCIIKPGTQQEVDQYAYIDGGWQEPRPLIVTGNGNPADYTVPLSDIAYTKIPNIYKAAQKEATRIAGGKVSSSFIARLPKPDLQGKPYWLVFIEGNTEKITGKFDLQGNLIQYDTSNKS